MAVLGLLGHIHPGPTAAGDVEIHGQTHAQIVEPAHELIGTIVIGAVYETAHTYVGALHQHPGDIEHAVTTLVPVVVLHDAPIHRPFAVTCIHARVLIYMAILHSHHDAGRLEGRTWFHQLAHYAVHGLVVFAIGTPLQVDNGLHVTCGHFHDHSHALFAVDERFLELVAQGSVGHILHVDVDGGHQVVTVLRLHIHQTHPAVTHLGAVLDARCSAQDAVKLQFESVLGLA